MNAAIDQDDATAVTMPSWDTATMAELFYAQGQKERALAIYRKLSEQIDASPSIHQRWQTLETELQNDQVTDDLQTKRHSALKAMLAKNPYSIACCLIGFDGIVIDCFAVGGADLNIGQIFTEVISCARKLLLFPEQPCVERMQELMLTTNRLATVVHVLNSQFCAVLLLEKKAFIGKARYELRRQADALRALL